MTSAPAAQTPPMQGVVLLRASLYVGDLHPEATGRDVAEVFRAVGPVLSVRLCRDRLTHKSLCYAYVNFFSLSDASWALACLNHTELRGKPMRIMWCQRDPLTRKTDAGNLYVKNLDPSITSARLEKIFSEYGTILSCKVAEENGISKGFGYVQFDSEDSAMTALIALHGTLLEGKNLYVSEFIKKSERKGTCGEDIFTNLYVKNLDDDLTEDLLKEKFSEHGKVHNAVIMKDDEGKSRGFGFVQFATNQEAKKAMEALNGAQIGSKTLFVGRAQKRAEREEILKRAHSVFNHHWQKDSNLYVKNLDISIDDRRLKEIFGAYGKVKSAKVMYHDNGVSKGFGFVSFTSPEEAKNALDALNGTTVQGLSLYVALAQHREERSRQLQNHYAEYQPEFYTSNWNTYNRKYHKPHFDFLPCPPLSIPYLSSQQLVKYPNFCRRVTGLSSFGVQKYWINHSASVALKGSEHGTGKELVFQHNAMKYDHNLKWEIGNIHGAADASSIGSTSEKSFIAASSTWMCKKNIDQMLHPLVDNNIQDQMLKPANSQRGSNGAFTLSAKSSCSLHL